MSDVFIVPEWIKAYRWWQIILPKLFGMPIEFEGEQVGALYKGTFYYWGRLDDE